MAGRRAADDRAPRSVRAARERLRRELEARGIDPVFVDAVLARLAECAPGGPHGWHPAILDGVVAAYRAHQKGQENLRRSLRELGDMSRLMEDFAGELRKLDEALKTLAVYLGRMRVQTAASGGRTLH